MKPCIHNKKLLSAIHVVVIEHSGNGELADSLVEYISASSDPEQPKSSDGSGFPKSGSSSPATVREQMEEEWTIQEVYDPDSIPSTSWDVRRGRRTILEGLSKFVAKSVVSEINDSIKRLAPSGIVEQPKKETDSGKP